MIYEKRASARFSVYGFSVCRPEARMEAMIDPLPDRTLLKAEAIGGHVEALCAEALRRDPPGPFRLCGRGPGGLGRGPAEKCYPPDSSSTGGSCGKT